MIYTGIGSRETPKEIMDIMTEIAKQLDKSGWLLRSGGAQGADSAFEMGSTNSEIFVPWSGFNNREHGIVVDNIAADIVLRYIIGEEHYKRLKVGALKLHTRNIYQVMGKDLNSPSKCVICYTDGGLIKGGTATAIKLANHLKIPVFNLGKNTDLVLQHIENFVNSSDYETITF